MKARFAWSVALLRRLLPGVTWTNSVAPVSTYRWGVVVPLILVMCLSSVEWMLAQTPDSHVSAQEGTPASTNWLELEPALVPRSEGQSAVVDGKLFVFSGFTEHAWPVIYITETTEMYDPESGQWSLRAPMPQPVTHTAAAVAGDSVWIAGGFVGDHPGAATDAVQIYDTEADSWSTGPPLPAARASGALVRLGRRLHFFGGLLPDRDTDVGDHYVLDLERQDLGWMAAAPLPEPRNHLGGAVVAGRIYALGGQHGHDVMRTLVSYVHAYDPATDTWERRADLPAARSHFEPGTLVVGGRVIIAGGVASGARNKPSTDLLTAYDPFTDTWSRLAPLPEKLLAPVAKVIGSQLLVSHGGREGGVYPETRAWSREIAGGERDTAGFWPERLHVTAASGEITDRDVLLWDTGGDKWHEMDWSSAPWVREVTPEASRATVEGTVVKVVFDATGLEPGMYTGSVYAETPDSPPAHLELSLNVTGDPLSAEIVQSPSPITIEPPFPNPFTSESVLRFRTSGRETVRVKLYTALGQQTRVLYEGIPQPGVTQALHIYGSDLPNGVYFVDLQSGTFRVSTPLLLAR